MTIRLMPTLLLAMVAVLSGCATSQPVTQIDKDTYLLVASSRWRGNDGVAAAGVGNYVGSQIGGALGLKSADFDATSASGIGRIALAGVAAGVASSVGPVVLLLHWVVSVGGWLSGERLRLLGQIAKGLQSFLICLVGEPLKLLG